MLRPKYETAYDLANETTAQEVIEAEFKCKLHKLPVSYHADWVATRNNKVVAVIEFKKRTVDKNRYATTFIFVDKWMNGIRLSDTMAVPFMLFIEWTDGLYWHHVGSTPVEFTMGGRTDRGDPQDIQPSVHIPVTAFKKVTKG
jgi:hypothetical protein